MHQVILYIKPNCAKSFVIQDPHVGKVRYKRGLERIIALHKSGLGYKAVSKRLCLLRSTVQYTVKKEKLWGTVKNLNQSGRKRKMSRKLRRKIMKNVTTDPRTSVKDIKAHLGTVGVDVSFQPLRDLCTSQLPSQKDPSPQEVPFKSTLEVCQRTR